MLGQIRHFLHNRPSHAHIMKHDHCPGDLTIPVVDRSGGVFDYALISIPSNQDTVRAESHGPVFLNCQLHGIWGGLMRSAVNDFEHITERMAHSLLPGPSSHMFRDYIQVGHASQDVGAQYSVTNGVQGDLS